MRAVSELFMTEIVHCPKCKAAVSVAPQQAGQKVQCPGCLKSFLAPSVIAGSSGSAAGDDDDWLSLDDSPPVDPPADPPATSATPTQSSTNPYLSSQPPSSSPSPPASGGSSSVQDDNDIFDDVEVIQEPAAGGHDDPNDLFAGLPSLEEYGVPPNSGQSASNSSASRPSAAGKTSSSFADDLLSGAFDDALGGGVEAGLPGDISAGEKDSDFENEFRIKCSVCGSVLHVSARQSGQSIKCDDCFTTIKVPPPPKKKVAAKPSNEPSVMFEGSPQSTPKRPADPFQTSADELLKKAAEEPDEEFKPDHEAPDTVGWIKSVLGIFLDPGVIIHFVGLSIFVGAPAAFVAYYPMLAVGAFPLAMIGAIMTVTCGFAIMFSVANNHGRVDDWPTVDPASWFESMLPAIAATAIAVAPAFMVGAIFNATVVIRVALILFSVYVLFPFILLSMLDNQSIAAPFSADVSKSVTKCQDDWGALYFSAGLLFGLLFLYFVFTEMTPVAIAIGVSIAIAISFMYFAMIGRLALAIGDVVDLQSLETEGDDSDDVSS